MRRARKKWSLPNELEHLASLSLDAIFCDILGGATCRAILADLDGLCAMTKKSLRRLQKDQTLDFSNILPNHALPEDIPVLFRKTAEDLAGAFFDEQVEIAFHSNVPAERTRSAQFRNRWRNSKVYVKLNWASFIPIARTILADMLERPLGEVSLAQKDEIYNAFLEGAADKRLLDFSEALAPAN